MMIVVIFLHLIHFCLFMAIFVLAELRRLWN